MTQEEREIAQERALILAKKERGSSSSLTARPQKKKIELNLHSRLPESISEAELMKDLRNFYDQNQEIGFQSRYQALQQRFPKSHRLNEAHYMAGLLALANKNYGRAVKAFDLILKRSPKSKEAPQALFAKAITFKRMNLPETSQALLKQVQARYPKSIEAQRAAFELKIQEKRFE